MGEIPKQPSRNSKGAAAPAALPRQHKNCAGSKLKRGFAPLPHPCQYFAGNHSQVQTQRPPLPHPRWGWKDDPGGLKQNLSPCRGDHPTQPAQAELFSEHLSRKKTDSLHHPGSSSAQRDNPTRTAKTVMFSRFAGFNTRLLISPPCFTASQSRLGLPRQSRILRRCRGREPSGAALPAGAARWRGRQLWPDVGCQLPAGLLTPRLVLAAGQVQ